MSEQTTGTVECWLGLPGSGRREKLLEKIRESYGSGTEILWVVDSLHRAQSTESLLLDTFGTTVGIEVLPTGRLASWLLERSGEMISTLDSDTQTLLIKELLINNLPEISELPDMRSGWIRKVVEIKEELIQGTIPESVVRKKHPWISKLLAEYWDLLKLGGSVDVAQLPGLAAERITEAHPESLSLVIVDRLGPILPSLSALVHKLVEHSSRSIVLLDDLPDDTPSLSLSRADKKRWMNSHQTIQKQFQADPADSSLARNLFRTAGDDNDTGRGKFHIHAFYYNDRTEEVRSTAQRIAELVHQQKISPDQIAVVTTSSEQYTPLIEDTFPRYGLLADLKLGAPLSSSPLARLAGQLFELRENNLSRESITDILLNPYFHWGKVLSVEKNILMLDSMARQAGIREITGRFRESWLIPLQEYFRKARKELDKGLSYRKRKTHWSRQEIQVAEQGLAELQELVLKIAELPDTCTVDQAMSWLEELFSMGGTIKTIHAEAGQLEESQNRDRYAYGAILLLFKQIRQVLQLLQQPAWPVARFSQLFRYAISQHRLRPAARFRGGIPVLGVRDLRGLTKEIVFVLGLTSSNWPPRPEKDPLHPMKWHWRNGINGLAEGRALILEAILTARQLYFSAPCLSDEEGSEQPSPLFQDLQEQKLLEQNQEEHPSACFSIPDSLQAAGNLLSGGDEEQGSGRELLALSRCASEQVGVNSSFWERAERGIHIELLRQDPSSITEYEGMLTGSQIQKRIAEKLGGKSLSASSLKSYAKCPMRFFLEKVLKIEELEDVVDAPEPLTKGNLVHEILEETTERIREKMGGRFAFSEIGEDGLETLSRVADSKLKSAAYKNLYWKKEIAKLVRGLEDVNSTEKGVLRYFYDYELGKLKGETIVLTEVAFTQKESDNGRFLFSSPFLIGDEPDSVELGGRIDRISVNPKKGWRVWDYKYSDNSLPTAKKIKEGTEFQLPIYLEALKRYILEQEGTDAALDGAFFYQLRTKKAPGQTGQWRLAKHEEEWESFVERILAIHRAMMAGRFHHPLSDHPDLCNSYRNYCPFRKVCRLDHDLLHERSDHLASEALMDAYILPIQELRNDPAANEKPGEAGK